MNLLAWRGSMLAGRDEIGACGEIVAKLVRSATKKLMEFKTALAGVYREIFKGEGGVLAATIVGYLRCREAKW